MKVRVDDTQQWLYEIRRNDDQKGWHTFGGDEVALRAYQHWHPIATIHYVKYSGRTFWLTEKQLAIWQYVMGYHRRSRRTTLKVIAEFVHCSRATVSRFLKRLDLWRVVDVATLRGRNGGTYILTVDVRNGDADAWLSGAKPTYASRHIARDRIAAQIRRLRLNRLKVALEKYRLPPRPWFMRKGGGWNSIEQLMLPVVSTGATYR